MSKETIELHRGVATAVTALAAIIGALMAPGSAQAYNCGGRDWQTITVALNDNNAGHTSAYTVSTRVPNLSGCDLTVNTVVTIALPGDSSANTVTNGTLNGSAISFDSASGTNISFHVPVAVAYNQPVTILLNVVTNPSTIGSKTLVMSATAALAGQIGQTTSFPYTIIVPPTPTNTATPTLSLTPTLSATPSLTPTPTPTLTRTPTLTPTGGPCSFGLSGNDCVPGGGVKSTDCVMEWVTKPAPLPGRGGIPKNSLVCYEGDPSCDSDPNLGNKSCTFDVRICINNHDPRLSCVPLDLTGFEVKSPRPSHLVDAADTSNLMTLESQAGPGGFGVPIKRGKTTVSGGQANVNPDQCSPDFPIVVPLHTTPGGKVGKHSKTLRIAGSTSAGRKDTDTLRLECRPSTCGDGVMQFNETCDDGNRINGDGCNQGCQIEPPSPTPTLTPTPALPSNTPTVTPTPGPPTNTPTVTATATITPPMLEQRMCTFATGTKAFLQGKTISASVNLTGHQTWSFDVPDENGVRPILIPQGGTHFDPAVLPFGVGTLCARLGEDSSGIIDCEGGEPDYDILIEQDHNTSDPPPPGFDQDPTCSATIDNPFFGEASASLEGPSKPHPGVCNSPVHVTPSNTFAAGGMRLTERLFIRLITSGTCPADSAPLDDANGDIDITGSISTGTAKGVIYNINNTLTTMGTTGAGNGPSVCGILGTSACTTQIVGTPFGCTNIDNNVLTAGKLGFAFTVLDISPINDGIATLAIVCQ